MISGPAAAIERAKQVLADRRINTHAVPVSAAFHSTLVAAAEQPLRAALDAIAISHSAIPVFSNTTAAPYPDDAESARALLAGQLARPVEFVAQVEAMYASGARTFLEVGPDAKLTGLVRAILEGRDHVALAVDASRGSAGNPYDLACALATLAALGYAVDLNRWDEGGTPLRPAGDKKAALAVKISGANARPRLGVGADTPSRADAVDGMAARGPHPIAAPSPPRFRTEIDSIMNSKGAITAHHANGQASADKIVGRGVGEQHVESAPGAAHAAPAHDDLARALAQAQENLLALQKLAEQTARLHQQFLGGQEKTQEAFLKLLEHQERLSLALLDPESTLAPAGVLELDARDRNGQDEPAARRSRTPPHRLRRPRRRHKRPLLCRWSLRRRH